MIFLAAAFQLCRRLLCFRAAAKATPVSSPSGQAVAANHDVAHDAAHPEPSQRTTMGLTDASSGVLSCAVVCWVSILPTSRPLQGAMSRTPPATVVATPGAFLAASHPPTPSGPTLGPSPPNMAARIPAHRWKQLPPVASIGEPCPGVPPDGALSWRCPFGGEAPCLFRCCPHLRGDLPWVRRARRLVYWMPRTSR